MSADLRCQVVPCLGSQRRICTPASVAGLKATILASHTADSVARSVSAAARMAVVAGPAVDSGADEWESDSRGPELVGDLEAASVQETSRPRSVWPARRHRSPGLGAGDAVGEDLGSAGGMDGAIDAASAPHPGVGGIDDGVDVLGGDVAKDDGDLRHRSPPRGSSGRRTRRLSRPGRGTPRDRHGGSDRASAEAWPRPHRC